MVYVSFFPHKKLLIMAWYRCCSFKKGAPKPLCYPRQATLAVSCLLIHVYHVSLLNFCFIFCFLFLFLLLVLFLFHFDDIYREFFCWHYVSFSRFFFFFFHFWPLLRQIRSCEIFILFFQFRMFVLVC